jgi:hypothetical protein
MSFCCRSLAVEAVVCNDSLTATTLVATRRALSEYLPVTSDVLSLSALTSARAGTAGDALMAKKKDKR